MKRKILAFVSLVFMLVGCASWGTVSEVELAKQISPNEWIISQKTVPEGEVIVLGTDPNGWNFENRWYILDKAFDTPEMEKRLYVSYRKQEGFQKVWVKRRAPWLNEEYLLDISRGLYRTDEPTVERYLGEYGPTVWAYTNWDRDTYQAFWFWTTEDW